MDPSRLEIEGGGSFYMSLSTSSVRFGDPVLIRIVGDGVDMDAHYYNFVWNREGSWDEGEWDSTVERNGCAMPESSYLFTPDRPGRYRLFCDIEDKNRDWLGGVERWIDVAGTGDFVRPPLPAPDAPVVVGVDDVSMVFNMASERYASLKEYFIALSKHELTFKEFRALDHVTFDVRKGEAVGLVGTNGSGKSTMLKIVAGVLEPSEGRCTVEGTIAPLIELGAGFDPELTARENIYLNGALLGYKKEFIDERYEDIVAFAELETFMDMPLKNYSSGMVARIAFAIATINEPDILIVDETLSVGDQFFQAKCEKRIKELISSNAVTVLFVSHDIGLVERICDRVAWIEKGHLRAFGPTDEVCEQYRNMRGE